LQLECSYDSREAVQYGAINPGLKMQRFSTSTFSACLLAGVVAQASLTLADESSTHSSGIQMQFVDQSIRPQDDFYQYVNGKWLASTAIPPDKGRYGSFDKLRDDAKEQLRGIVEALPATADEADSDQKKIDDIYASFMDEAALEKLGLTPLRHEFATIRALHDKKGIASLIAHFNRIGISAPYTPAVHQDARNSTVYVFDLIQDGLGMPDRDYYLLDDAKLKQIREQYLQHIGRMLALADDADADHEASQILALETALARVQWTKVENRDPVKTYNKVVLAKLSGLMPDYDWKGYLAASGVAGRVDYLIIHQPSYMRGFQRILQQTPLPVWKAYFRWRLLSELAPYLSHRFVDEHFAFYGTAMRGIDQNEPRWKRGIGLVEESIGEGLGRLYVRRYFPPEAKARVEQLVNNLLTAYRADIQTLDWMGPQTRQKALEKLAKLSNKIGYPIKWRDYGSLQIVRGDVVGNLLRAEEFEYNRNLHKLGQPIDRAEWDMTPQTVNAYYNPEENEIVFPAAILQPPFFDPAADDAVNYGGIGAVIGHEISHGFDDQGSQYDADGNVLDPPGWFTQADLEQFKARTHALVAQYSAYEPVPGYHLNGELTLGENIADNSGLAIAYKAYQLALAGQPAPVIDGLSGPQRFFMGFAQVWRGKARENETIRLIKVDPHSPSSVRGSAPERNQQAFYDAFDVHEGDKMFLPPQQRVSLW
jgi:predicted metalloendopeptidase